MERQHNRGGGNSNTNNNEGRSRRQNDGDDRFLRQFAVQIAAVLREQEDEQQRQTSPSSSRRSPPTADDSEKSVYDLYKALVYDEPIVDRIPNLSVVATALGRQLLSSKTSTQRSSTASSNSASSYALSNRFINGLLYLCRSTAATMLTTMPTSSKATETLTDNRTEGSATNDDGGDSTATSLLLSTGSGGCDAQKATKYIMSKLAFVAMIEVPLQCCQLASTNGRDMETIRRYLGSFKGNDKNNNNTDEGDRLQQELDGSIDVITQNSTSRGANESQGEAGPQQYYGDDKNETKSSSSEVWAAESDPSDYDYGDGNTCNEGSNLLDDRASHLWADDDSWLDPKSLSRPDLKLTTAQAVDAISSLLVLANYNIFEAIFASEQSTKDEMMHFVSCLKELSLMFFLQETEHQSRDASHGPENDDNLSVIQLLKEHGKDHAMLSPLWILRDAALYQPRQYSSHYMEVLQTLLAAGQSSLSLPSGRRCETNSSVSSIVGLSSLSSWCLSGQDKNRSVVAVTVNTIVESMNDMSFIVEHELRQQSLSQQGDIKAKLSMTLVPILECLSGIWYNEFGPVPPSRTPIAQTLLNSGFLRQVLVLSMTSVDSKNTMSLNQPLHHALWGLCVAYPKVVGKYVFRFPGTAELVRHYAIRSDSMAQECVESFLWNIFAWIQCSENIPTTASGPNQIVWKNGSTLKGAVSAPLSVDECSEVCQKAWSHLCRLVEDSLKDLASAPTSEDKAKIILNEWERLLVFVKSPSISMESLSVIESSSQIDAISSILSNLPKIEEDSPRFKVKREDTDQGDSDHVEGRIKHSASHREVIYGQAHRLIKEYRTYIQGGTSAKTD